MMNLTYIFYIPGKLGAKIKILKKLIFSKILILLHQRIYIIEKLVIKKGLWLDGLEAGELTL